MNVDLYQSFRLPSYWSPIRAIETLVLSYTIGIPYVRHLFASKHQVNRRAKSDVFHRGLEREPSVKPWIKQHDSDKSAL